MKKVVFVFLFVYIVFFASLAFTDYLSIDTFDDGVRPNSLSGDYGIWSLDWNDSTQSCRMYHDRLEKSDDRGVSVRIVYDVDSENKAACGFFTLLGGVDLSKFDRLVFYIKGDKKQGFTKSLEVEISNPTEVSRYLVDDITDKWQRKMIPLVNFKRISDWSNITKLAIVIEDNNVTKKTGVIYIDDIYFSDSGRAM